MRRNTFLFSLFVLVFVSGLFVPATRAATSVQVLILPFSIHAEQDLSYLKTEIPDHIRVYLEQSGAMVVDQTPGAMVDATALSVSAIRQMGLQTGARYIIWGSMTRIGNGISLDIRMVETTGDDPVMAIFEAGSGMESLRHLINESVRKLSRRLFSQELVAGIRITGNQRIETDAIERVLRVKVGDLLRADDIANDVKNIHKIGYFDDVQVTSQDTPEGEIITFQVTEKPTIRRISFSGNQVFDTEKLRENLSIKTGSILNVFTIKSNIDQLESLYKDKNYHNVSITYAVTEQDNNQADIKFSIEEGDKVKITQITFQGNQTFTDKELLKLIKTSERGFWSWLTSSGELNREDLNQDAGRIMAKYHTSGFIYAKVADPVVTFLENSIHVAFKIEEGERFRVGQIDVDGDLIVSRDILMAGLSIAKEPYFNREQVRQDIVLLTDIYADAGYAYVSINPVTKEHPDTHLVDITYSIDKGEQVFFEDIEIVGNTRTRDNVIRRELRIYEQHLYSGSRLKRSVRNLNRLDYFEDVKVDTPKGSADNLMKVKVEVKEKPTGAFTFGAGYSTEDKMFFAGSIAQRNLFGKGLILRLGGQIGASSDLYNVSLTDPWLFDIPLSGSAGLYRQKREYDTYDRTSRGGSVSLSYPIWDYTRASVTYRFDVTDVDDVDYDASDNIKSLTGNTTTSSITLGLAYDSRDKTFNTTSGQNHRIAYTYAGVGGNVEYNKVIAELGWYIPVYKDLVSFIHGETGFIQKNGGEILPDYEKFYLGGMNSIRGFDFQDIHIPTVNSEGYPSEEGGLSYAQFNFELTYPIVKDLGIVGVIFYDTGNVYEDKTVDLTDLRQSAGYGIRWYSPVGPIRIEAGHILDPKDDESSSPKWEFSMGTAF
ncbi:outer membrane protein assembly factor BamA [Desulfosarcina sp. OttesenSCG-928-A07]|nr:outer membrane protein assembly factor BamA [Desulfosarcina sp. OttesenSCG-928-A07]